MTAHTVALKLPQQDAITAVTAHSPFKASACSPPSTSAPP